MRDDKTLTALRNASEPRRLRFKETKEIVPAPPLPDGHFHVFLSHVWATAQDQMRQTKDRLRDLMPNVKVFLGEISLALTMHAVSGSAARC